MDKIVFTGCSFTAGNGWVDTHEQWPGRVECKDSPNLWVNLCHGGCDQLKNLELINAGQGGASNTEIFTNTVAQISQHGVDIKILFCQWTSGPRYSFRAGVELWPTRESIGFKRRGDQVDLKRDSPDRKYRDDLLSRLRVLHHQHGEILKVVQYSNILQKLAQHFGIKLYFINGICPWDQNYFVRLTGVMPEEFTTFTKNEILNIESRDDDDIFRLYKIIHDEYDQAGGIDAKYWVNLYDSMVKNKIDTNYDDIHPGTKSNQLYFEQIKNFLETQ